MKCDEVIERILSTVHQFTDVHKTDSAIVIVSPEVFACISPALRDVKHDKTHSEGKLGQYSIKSDLLAVKDTTVTVYKPFDYRDILRLRAEDYLPEYTIPKLEKLHKRAKKAKRKAGR